MTKDELIAFETEVGAAFNAGQIRAPVHLAGGNEDQLIRIFKDVRPGDWVLGTWHSHYHCLLHGISPKKLMKAIRDGRSISLCFPEHLVLCSGIVAGCLPIAVGIAAGIKRAEGAEKVWIFVGDMAARTGAFHEARQYAVGHDMPITFIVEDNGKSVLTATAEAWGPKDWFEPHVNQFNDFVEDSRLKTIIYKYELPWPHAGAGIRVTF